MRISERFAYNLATKACYWGKPRIVHPQRSIGSMVDHEVENIVSNITVPLIECAIGNSKINIHIYYLKKDAVMMNLHYKRSTLFMSSWGRVG